MTDAGGPKETIESAFRGGSLTAISVLVGFSLSFLARWAALPGTWMPHDLVAVGAISLGILAEIVAVAALLSLRSLERAHYEHAIRIFLLGLGLVGLGVVLAIFGDILGVRQQTL